jgi:hypothetical protein
MADTMMRYVVRDAWAHAKEDVSVAIGVIAVLAAAAVGFVALLLYLVVAAIVVLPFAILATLCEIAQPRRGK